MENNHNKEQKRIRKKECVEFATHAFYPIPHLHIISHPLGSISPLRGWYYRAAQTEIRD